MKRLLYLFPALVLSALLIYQINVASLSAEDDVPDSIFTQEDPTEGSSEYFLKLSDINGESQREENLGEIEILSFSWGETNETQAGRGGLAKIAFEDFSIKTRVSAASPQIFEAAVNGRVIPEAVFTAYKSSGNGERFKYLEIKLQEVVIVNYNQDGVNNTLPMDSFSLNFNKVEYEYTPQKADGTADPPVKAGYDIKKNQKI